MKKLTSILLITVILASLLSLSSCGDSKKYKTVKLDKYNYSDYIVFNYYYADIYLEEEDVGYKVSCVIHAESGSRNPDYRFDNVTITLKSGRTSLLSPVGDITLNLDGLGSSHGTAQYINGSSFSGKINDDWKYEVNSITGNVLVPAN